MNKPTDTLTPEELAEIEERISQDDVAISHGMRTEVDPADYFEIAEQLLAHIRATDGKLKAIINGEEG